MFSIFFSIIFNTSRQFAIVCFYDIANKINAVVTKMLYDGNTFFIPIRSISAMAWMSEWIICKAVCEVEAHIGFTQNKYMHSKPILK